MAYVFRLTLGIVLSFFSLTSIVSLLISIGTVFILTLFYSSDIQKKVICTTVVCISEFLAEGVTAAFMGLGGFHILNPITQKNLFSGIMISFVFWSITIVIRRFQMSERSTQLPKLFIVAVIIFPVTSIYLMFMVFEKNILPEPMAEIALFLVLTSDFILVYLYDSLSKMFEEKIQSALVRQEKDYYYKQLELLQKNDEELKRFRHDMRNRMEVIQTMLIEKEYVSAFQYVEKVSEKLLRTESYSHTGNIAADSIINSKLTKAQEIGVRVNASIGMPKKLRIEEDDLVVIFGNLLDNAVEAAERTEENRFILVEVHYEQDTLLIHVANSYDSFMKGEDGSYLTRKEDKALHGIGLKSVEMAVQRYDGTLEIKTDEESFQIDVLLYA